MERKEKMQSEYAIVEDEAWEYWEIGDDYRHREDSPAYIEDEAWEYWDIGDDYRHREDSPARIEDEA